MLLNKNNINLLIDFDSTFIRLESLDVISELSLQNDKNKILKIMQITNKAMKGEISFSKALVQRIAMLDASKEHLNKAIELLESNISISFINNIDFFKNNSEHIFIISGGFKDIIFPIVKKFNIKYDNIFANEFLFNNQNIISGINKNNPLSKDQGKVSVAKKIYGKNIIIGDGYTDYEIKKYNGADFFIQFIENVNRTSINNKADLIANNFDEVITFINDI